MNEYEQKLLEILIKESYITDQDAKKAVEALKVQKISLIDYLIKSQIINKPLLGQAIAESLGVSFADLETNEPIRGQVLNIPKSLANLYRIVLVNETEDSVTIATDNPKKDQLLHDLQVAYPKKKVVLAYAFPEDIDLSFVHYRDPLTYRLTHIVQNQSSYAPQMLEEILKEALTSKASDIHFEPQEEQVIIRFRIDGALYEAGRIHKTLYINIVNRIKIQAKLRIDEHNTPQDGAIRISTKEITADLRISIIPTLDGEKIAIRILSQYVQGFALSDLGLSGSDQKMLLESSKKPFGMILVTGPTGSGKTTTLYALLKLLNKSDVNITTIEDPVEYKIFGVNQIQVNPATKLTFASGLKSIVRQDPNIILVGEIRDLETAEIAVNAALTGHLLLSTFHANDAATSIPRLLDMGIEPFLMASTLELVIAQRLVRKICNVCKFSQSYTKDYLMSALPKIGHYFPDQTTTFYRGKGCNNCSGTGYKGRVALYEFIKMTPNMQELILKSPSTHQIWQQAKTDGSSSLFEDGVDKIKNGLITLEELLRVAQSDK